MPLAYLAHPAITRDVMIAESIAHREADRLVASTYWTDGRGCAVGCSLETVMRRTGEMGTHHDHERLAARLGIPAQLAHLQDTLFEGLPRGEREAWPERFYAAIQTGADLSGVPDQFLGRTLREVVLPTVQRDEDADVRAVVERVAQGCATGWSEDDRAAAGAAANRTMATILCEEIAAAPVLHDEAL